MKAPCKNCTIRHESCHAHCDEYLEWSAERKKLHSVIRKEKEIMYVISDTKKRSYDKYLKGRRK